MNIFQYIKSTIFSISQNHEIIQPVEADFHDIAISEEDFYDDELFEDVIDSDDINFFEDNTFMDHSFDSDDNPLENESFQIEVDFIDISEEERKHFEF